MAVELYGKTKTEKDAERMFQCRQIVHEVLNFGVNQQQILRIIKLLSLELEDRRSLEILTSAIKDIEEPSVTTENKLIT